MCYVIHRETHFKNTVTIKTAVPLSHFPNVQLKPKQNREKASPSCSLFVLIRLWSRIMLGMWGKTTENSSPHSFLYQKFGNRKKKAFGVNNQKNLSFKEILVPKLNYD